MKFSVLATGLFILPLVFAAPASNSASRSLVEVPSPTAAVLSAYASVAAPVSVSSVQDVVQNMRKQVRHLVKDAQHGVVEKNPLLLGGRVYNPSQNSSSSSGSSSSAAPAATGPLGFIDLVFTSLLPLFQAVDPSLKQFEEAINAIVAGGPISSFIGTIGAPFDMLIQSGVNSLFQLINGANELTNNLAVTIINTLKGLVDGILGPFLSPSAAYQAGGETSGLVEAGLRRRREAFRLAVKNTKPYIKPVLKVAVKVIHKVLSKAKRIVSQERLGKIASTGIKYSQKAKEMMSTVFSQATVTAPSLQPVLESIISVGQRFISAVLIQDPQIFDLVMHPSIDGLAKAFEAIIRVLTQRIQ
ncbi:hypothetical protein DFQ28_009833 [Apophysomyces sp. BC1034]|nr:hypothetical protein DFQ30_009152 [Apophysomyces sp. BC1015]KAG0172435.1 hypothetical protein DFQ29_008398 [Apophysomyces sp. BC1021]KAG0185178.1 hypothetical protein DFQ28_009833 [Apophysomyces sp. BC1034]